MYRMVCARCGQYIISWEALQFPNEPGFKENTYILSGLARELYETKQKALEVTIVGLPDTLKHYLIPDVKSIDEKVAKLLKRIKERTSFYGEWVELVNDKDFPLAYAKKQEEFMALLSLLADSGLIKQSPTSAGENVVLTAKGWQQASDLMSNKTASTQGFIAVWFDPAGSMDDSIEAVEEAIKEAGFKPLCIRDEHFAERIMDKALGEIRRSKFVIVDLTGSRPSVFFEAGFANGLGIEAVYIYRKGTEKDTPSLDFYTRHYQCYGYKDATELREVIRDVLRARYSAK